MPATPQYSNFFNRMVSIVRCQTKVHNCKCSYLCCNIILLCSEILLLIEFCFIVSLILLIFSPWPKYTSLAVRLSNDSWNLCKTLHTICLSQIFFVPLSYETEVILSKFCCSIPWAKKAPADILFTNTYKSLTGHLFVLWDLCKSLFTLKNYYW